MRSHWHTVFGLTCAALGACGDGFDPRSLLSSYRVVGVTVSANEVSPADSLTLKAWDFDPRDAGLVSDARPPTYAWSLCPVPLGSAAQFQCLTLEGVSLEMPLEGDAAEITVDLGPDGLDLVGTVLPKVSAALAKLPGGATDGLPVTPPPTLPLQFRLRAGDPSIGVVQVVRTVSLRLAPSESAPPNKSPRLAALTADARPFCEASVEAGAPECFAGAPVGTTLNLRVELDSGPREVCTADDLAQARCPDATPPIEALTYSWFTSAGELEFDFTNDETPENALKLPARLDEEGREAQKVYVFAVVRDGRGGLDVLEASFDMTRLP